MSEEIDNPKRNLPLATIFGMGIVILVNVLLNLSCIGAVGFKELAGADTPVSMAAMTIFGPIGAAIVTLGALISIFGSLNGAIMGPPRVVYAMSKDNMLFGFFSKLHPKFNTPYITLIIFGVVAIFFLWTGSFMTLLMMGTFVSVSYTHLDVYKRQGSIRFANREEGGARVDILIPLQKPPAAGRGAQP